MNLEQLAEQTLKSLPPGRMVHVRKGVIVMRGQDGRYWVRDAKDPTDLALAIEYEEAWMKLVQYLTESYPTPSPELA